MTIPSSRGEILTFYPTLQATDYNYVVPVDRSEVTNGKTMNNEQSEAANNSCLQFPTCCYEIAPGVSSLVLLLVRTHQVFYEP